MRRAPLWPIGSLVTCTSTVWPGAEGVLDALGLVGLEAGGVPVDLTGVEHGVAALADVDEGGLHRGQDVLHAAEVDVAGHRDVRGLVDVVLDEDAVLEHAHLGAALLVAHDHDAVDGLTAGEELGLGDDRAATTGLAALATALLLGLEAGRALDGGRLVVWLRGLAHAGRDAGGVVAGVGRGAGTAAATATTARGALVVRVGTICVDRCGRRRRPVAAAALVVAGVVPGVSVAADVSASVSESAACCRRPSSSRSEDRGHAGPCLRGGGASDAGSTRPPHGRGVGVWLDGPRPAPSRGASSTSCLWLALSTRHAGAGVTGPASRTAERRRRVGVALGGLEEQAEAGDDRPGGRRRRTAGRRLPASSTTSSGASSAAGSEVSSGRGLARQQLLERRGGPVSRLSGLLGLGAVVRLGGLGRLGRLGPRLGSRPWPARHACAGPLGCRLGRRISDLDR